MSKLFTAIAAVMLIFCVIWGYSWLEVWRDPKAELINFYQRNPRAKVWVARINKLWIPALLAGLIFVAADVVMGGKS